MGVALVTIFVAVAICYTENCSVGAFTVRATPTTSSTSLLAASLTPPKSMEALLKDTLGIYDDSVQKTYGRFPLVATRGKGCMLYDDVNNAEYIDCVAGIATCILGHANAELSAAIASQMNSVHHVSNLYLIPTQAGLADWLTANSVAEKIFFCNSGAEANEAAIKCARKHYANHAEGVSKPVILSAKQSFHGRTLAALSATAQPKYHEGFTYDDSMVQGFDHFVYNDIDSLREAVERATSDGQGLAAIMIEALQGEGGIIPGDVEFFKEARAICDKHNALLVCDEVQIGMGRSGKLWGYENLNISPDIFTSAKALGGGVPIGAMCARGAAATTFGPGDHASTYGGNPLACAAGMAVAQYMSDNNILENVQARGKQLTAGLNAIAEKYPDVLGSVRGWGLLQGIVVKEGYVPGTIVQSCMDSGLLVIGAGADVVRFVPPLIITESELSSALNKFDSAIEVMLEKSSD